MEFAEIYVLKEHQKAGKADRKKRGLDDKFPIHQLPRHDQDRNINQKVEITGVELEHMLNHGGDTAHTGWRKAVGEDKQRVGQRHAQSK